MQEHLFALVVGFLELCLVAGLVFGVDGHVLFVEQYLGHFQ